MRIDRNPEAAAEQTYDLIVIGGGIYGVMLTFEAVRHGLTPLLLEMDDHGSKTSFNSLRIIHGGLRDLQSLNINRFLKFGNERQWYLQHFPEFAEKLPVLMPLYQKGLKRTQLFHAAFLLDRLLYLLTGKLKYRQVPYGKVLSSEEVRRRFPEVNEEGLKGGALWYDAAVPDSQRFIIELLLIANNNSAVTLNYMKAIDVHLTDGSVSGVIARDRLTGKEFHFGSNKIINAAGPWNSAVAEKFGEGRSALRPISLMWNVLFDREALSECAIGISSQSEDDQIYFLHPWKGRLLAGTGHSSRKSMQDNPQPTQKEINEFILGLNEAIPTLNITNQEILHIYSGFVAVKETGTLDLTKHDYLIDHSQENGPPGLYSIQGTKFTAARNTAESVIDKIFNQKSVKNHELLTKESDQPSCWKYDYQWFPDNSEENYKQWLQSIIRNESVVYLDDLIIRRTSLGDNPERAIKLAPSIAELFEWSGERKKQEIQRIHDYFHWCESSDSHL